MSRISPTSYQCCGDELEKRKVLLLKITPEKYFGCTYQESFLTVHNIFHIHRDSTNNKILSDTQTHTQTHRLIREQTFDVKNCK